jgi:hypothetical protein
MTTDADVEGARACIATAQQQLTDADALLASETPEYHARIDTIAEPKPPPLHLGPAPFAFPDPVFGTDLIRVTDEHTAGGTSLRVPSNAHVAAWNTDGTRFYVMKATGGSQFFHFDPTRRRVRLDLFDVDRLVGLKGPKGADPIDVGSYVEPSFSYEDPDVVICGGGDNHRTIYAVDLRTGTKTVRCNLDERYAFMADVGGYMNALVTAAQTWAVAFGGAAQDLHHFVHVQRVDGWWGGQDLYEWGCHVHSVALDQSGRYVLIYTTSADIQAGRPKLFVWDTVADTMTGVYQPQHFVSGHDCVGYGLSINQDAQGQYDGLQWQRRALMDPTVSVNVLPATLQPPETYVEDHSNWRNVELDNTQPFFSFTWRHDTSTTPWRAWDDEIIGVRPDGSCVYRFAHHQSIGGDQEFWDQCIGNMAPAPIRWGMFTSNWGKTLAAARQDVFLFHTR